MMNETSHSLQRGLLWFVYLLYVFVVPALIGVAINLFQTWRFRNLSARGRQRQDSTMQTLTTHHQWLLRTFVGAVGLAMAGLGTLYYGAGYIFAIAAIVFWYYRVLRGMTALLTGDPLPGQGLTNASTEEIGVPS